ncbi:LacI family DNA-binding transcriptional regulator [Arthrobacter sp. NPDC093139]|uniref:LacI family DNA-binding transcriptional regulator n=1 Tax=Arthrobacter sp. NPDC093139 TaxID=3363945 RepID=UPI003808AE15
MARPTLASLAAELGVSRQTISNVLNAPQRVKPATLDRVRAAIEAAGYRPSAAARQLRTRRSMNLGMRLMPVTDGINGSILDRFLHALTESAQGAGYRLTLFCADSHEDEVLQYGELLHVAGIDGFILTSSSRDDVRTKWLQDNGTPFAVFGRPWEDASAQHPWVDIDGAAGTGEAVSILAGQGHTRIAFLGWKDGGSVGDDRQSGWERAMGALGFSEDGSGLCTSATDTVTGGISGGRELIERGATAIVCASDSLAIGAAEILRELRPEQFLPGRPAGPGLRAAVVGFDDTPVAAALGLSSVAQPVEDAARHIVRLLTFELADRRGEGSAPEQHVLLAPHVVERVPLPLAAPH